MGERAFNVTGCSGAQLHRVNAARVVVTAANVQCSAEQSRVAAGQIMFIFGREFLDTVGKLAGGGEGGDSCAAAGGFERTPQSKRMRTKKPFRSTFRWSRLGRI